MAFFGEMTQVESGDGTMVDCYFAEATGAAMGGVVVIMEAFGLNDHIKQVCDGYADRGYDAIAPALYDRIERNFDSGYSQDGFAGAIKNMQETGFDTPILDAQASIDFLRNRASGNIGIVGYCYGGAITWLAAARCEGLAAASAYYGTAILQFPDAEPKCPTILHFGRTDSSTPEDRVAEIAKAHPDVPIHWYDAGHGFNNAARPDAYHAESAELALGRTIALFEKNLA